MNRPFELQSHTSVYAFLDWRVVPKYRKYQDWDRMDAMNCDTLVNGVARDPAGIGRLRALWTDWHGRAPDAKVTNQQIARDLIAFIERKQLVVLQQKPVRVTAAHTPPQTQKAQPVKPEPVLDYEWRWECAHHKKGDRALVLNRPVIQIVPSSGEVEEQVTLHLREKHQHATPSSLKLSTGDEIKKSGADGGYDTYPAKVKWKGSKIETFLTDVFWKNYRRVDTYDVSGPVPGLRVEVFHPCTHKIEMSLPPCKKYQTGAKLGEVVQAASNWVQGKPRGKKVWEPDPGNKPWSPSRLNLKNLKKFQYSMDNHKVELPILEVLGAIIKTAQTVSKITETIQDSVPKVGWYLEFGFSLLEGGLALEWCWKEHTDHRVFQYIDLATELKIFGISLEVGFGLARAKFKAQAYLMFEGEVSVAASVCRNDPDCVATFKIPFGASIKGSVGFRVEVGNWVRGDIHGESSIGLDGDLAVNRSPSEMLSVDGVIKWSGLAIAISGSVGPEGYAGEFAWEGELMSGTELGNFHWPGEKYEPPTMSRAAMAKVLEDVITDGTNVRVRGASSWEVAQIANALAAKMDEHKDFLRTPKSVEGIAHAIRADLDELTAQSTETRFFMTVIPEPVFRAYVAGPKLKAHLDKAVNPGQSLMTA
ncbi:MAG TPA: hypothetical protein VEB43_03955 [Anaeromyxobacter sp.]|nr:hypothetical protein [Anaeromyxobacter sp.]